MKRIDMPVISYCDIPEELTEGTWMGEMSPDCYIQYSLPKLEDLHKYGLDKLNEYLSTTYPELIGTTFLIEIDY